MDVSSFNVDFIAKYWHRRAGFAALLLPLLALEAYLLHSDPASLAVVAALSAIAVEAIWRITRRLPRTRRGKLGFVICIACDDEAHGRQVRADLIFNLHRLLKVGHTGPSFQVIEIPQFRAEKVVHLDDAQRIRIETRAHFVLYGRVRRRSHGGKEHHFVELDGIVSHTPISQEASNSLGREFSELLPRKLLIPGASELFAFEFTSDWTEVVARYVIGVAAQLSGDYDYAEKLYSDSRNRLDALRVLPISAKLRERIPTRLAEMQEGRAIAAYEAWATTHSEDAVEKLHMYLAPIEAGTYRSPATLNLLAICAFLRNRDVDRSLHWLEQIVAQNRDGTWHLNVAFLYAYKGNLRRAVRHYRSAGRLRIEPEVIGKIEDFVCHIAQIEPSKCQLYFCLGFFNWHIKGDTVQAAKDFGAFVSTPSSSQYPMEVQLAGRWVEELGKLSG